MNWIDPEGFDALRVGGQECPPHIYFSDSDSGESGFGVSAKRAEAG